MTQKTVFVFKLRGNIILEGDLDLARMELEAFMPDGLEQISELTLLAHRLPLLIESLGIHELSAHTRSQGSQGFLAVAPISLLHILIARLSFVQQIYCLTSDTQHARAYLESIEAEIGPVISFSAVGEHHLAVKALTHYALFEFSGVIARRSSSPLRAKENMTSVLEALVSTDGTGERHKLVDSVMSARLTTSHLSHDVHYYKAKFFPRLARALINICERRATYGSHRVIDNFVGSGTTLLESASLGIPSVGLDIDPLSIMISRAKLELMELDSALLADEGGRIKSAMQAGRNGQLNLFDTNVDTEENLFPSWLLKNRRMDAETASDLQREVGRIKAAISGCDPRTANVLRVLLSDAIARKIRMRFLGTGVGRFSLSFAKSEINEMFVRSLERSAKTSALSEWVRDTLRVKFATAQTIEADSRSVPLTLGKFDILVTSPPYVPASSGRESYAQARAPSLVALGLRSASSVKKLADESIGAMNGQEVNLEELTQMQRGIVQWLQSDKLRAIKAFPTAQYFLDMRMAFRQMHSYLSPGALAVVVSGKQSTFYQFATRKPLHMIPSAEILADEACNAGFELEMTHDVQLQKANANARPRSLDDYYETLIVLRKPQ